MGKYWLLDRHGSDGPSVLVETDGSMRVVDVLRFGPEVSELDDQQAMRDDVIGRLAPTMRPFVAAAKVSEQGIDPHADLKYRDGEGAGRRAAGSGAGRGASGGRAASGAKRTGGRGRG